MSSAVSAYHKPGQKIVHPAFLEYQQPLAQQVARVRLSPVCIMSFELRVGNFHRYLRWTCFTHDEDTHNSRFTSNAHREDFPIAYQEFESHHKVLFSEFAEV